MQYFRGFSECSGATSAVFFVASVLFPHDDLKVGRSEQHVNAASTDARCVLKCATE